MCAMKKSAGKKSFWTSFGQATESHPARPDLNNDDQRPHNKSALFDAVASVKTQMELTFPSAELVERIAKEYGGNGEELLQEIQATGMLVGQTDVVTSTRQQLISIMLNWIFTSRLQKIEETYKKQSVHQDCVQELEQAFFEFNYELSKALKVMRVKQTTDVDVLSVICQKLAPVEDAGFDAARGRSRCFPGTRRDVLKNLRRWATLDSSQQVFWLQGDGGTGKTTIAQTITEKLFVDGTLGASFFCSCASWLRADAEKIIPTIAYQLASSTKAASQFRAALLETLDDAEYSISSPQDVEKQFQRFIVQPARQSDLKAVIVLDGLEECKDRPMALALLSILANYNSISKGSSLKFLVTIPSLSTWDTAACGVPQALASSPSSKWKYHNLQQDPSNSADIRLFLSKATQPQQRLTDLGSRFRKDFADKPGVVFIIAVVAQQLIAQSAIPDEALQPILETSTPDINTLYRFIIDFNPAATSSSKLSSALGLLAVSQEPQGLSFATLVDLLEHQPSAELVASYRGVLAPLHPLLNLPEAEDNNSPITFRHKSFLDFLIVSSGAQHDSSPYVDVNKRHRIAALGCLQHMITKLEKKNICSKFRYAPNEPRHERIDDTTKYCSRYWSHHLCEVDEYSSSKEMDDLKEALSLFLSTRQLHWVEVLALLGEIDHGKRALKRVQSWLMNNDVLDDSELLIRVIEGQRFIAGALDAATQSALHIYHSVLPFTPQSAVHRLQYGEEDKSGSDKEVTVLVGRGAWMESEGAMQSIRAHDWVRSLSFCSGKPGNDGNAAVMLAASGDRFCNLYTNADQANGAELTAELDPEPQYYRVFHSATFSSDSELFATASHRKITVWNTTDLSKSWTLPSPEGVEQYDAIRSISFHPSQPRLLLIRYSSKKAALSLWLIQEDSRATHRTIKIDGRVGAACWHNHPKLPSDHVQVLIADDNDGCMTIWTIDLSQAEAKPERKRDYQLPTNQSPQADSAKESELLTTATGSSPSDEADVDGSNRRITSIASSADGLLVAWGSESGDLVVFNAEDGTTLLHKSVKQEDSESKKITSLQFSPSQHDNLLACASGSTVYLYCIDPVDPNLCGFISKFSAGHSDDINTIAFSPNGEILASGGDDSMIYLWNINYHHRHQITCVSTSDDGRLILSGSEDKTVRVWDKQSGRLVQVLRGVESKIYDMVFFLDSERKAYIFAVGFGGQFALWAAQKAREPGSEVLFDIMPQDSEQKALGFSFRADKKTLDSWSCSFSRYALPTSESPSKFSAPHAGFFSWVDDYWGSTTRIECWTLRNKQMVLAAVGVLPADYDERVEKVGHMPLTASQGITVVAKCLSDRYFSATWQDARGGPPELSGSSPASLQFSAVKGEEVSDCNWEEHDLTWSNESMGKWVTGKDDRNILWVPPKFRGFGFWDGNILIQGGESGMLAVVDFQGVDTTSTDKILE